MSDRDLRSYLVRAALDAGFRERALADPDAAMADYDLDEADRDALRGQDARMLALIGRALRAGGDFTGQNAAEAGEPDAPAEPPFREITLPEIELVLRIQPYARRTPEGDLSVDYSAHVFTGEPPDGPGAPPPGMEGQALNPADVRVRASPTGLLDPDGALGVRYDVRTEHAPAVPVPAHAEPEPTPPEAPRAGARRAPAPWGHRRGTPDVLEAAAAVRAAPENRRGPMLAALARALTSGPAVTPQPGPAPAAGPPAIHVLGLGVKAGMQLTGEARQALGRVREVLFVDNGVGTREMLEPLCPRVTSLFDRSYAEEDARLDAYHRMAVAVIEAALARPPVAFAMHGHPVVGAYAPVLIRDMADALGLAVEVQPGICHMDSLYAELLLDPFVQGLQMYEATDLLLRRRPLQPDVPALLFQVGNVETRLHSARVSRPERMARLVSHLRHDYPAEHRVRALYVSPHPLMASTEYEFPLMRLGEYAHVLHPGFTLYLPPVGERPITDPVLAALVDSPAHLRRVTAGRGEG